MARGRWCAAVVAVALVPLAATQARADRLLPPVTAPYFVPGNTCYNEVEIFRSLKYGDFDYCRLKLRYRPGRAECLRIIISTCNLVAPGKRRFGPPGGIEGFGERTICPPGPPPPTCPSGFFD